MSNKAKNKKSIQPKLRFPEFQNDGDWDKKKLSDMLFESKKRNRNLRYKVEDVLSVSGEHGCVNQIQHLGRSYAGASVANYHVVETGDIVYTKSPLKRNPYGIIKENKGKAGIVSTLYAVYRATEICHPRFLDHYFSRDYNLNSYLQPLVKKGAKNDMKVNNTYVLSGEIFAPKKKEQQKIADCLSSLDELIEAEGQKLNALKDHKKGLMQNLFPADGQTLPARRFTEFQNAPEWKKVNLDTLFGESIEKKHPKKTILAATQDRGVIPYELLEKLVIRDERNLIGYKLVREGDFVISLRSFEGGFEYSNYEGIISPAYVILQRKQKINDSFFRILFKTDIFIRSIQNLLNNNLRDGKSISYNQAKELELIIPDPLEQKKIADFLSSIDDIIKNQNQKFDALRDHKKGLMQQLFPAVSEVQE